MSKIGTAIIIILALVFSAGAAVMVMDYLKNQAQATVAVLPTVPVVVSAKDVSFGRTLEQEDLRVVMYPEESVPKGAVSEIDSLVGQTTKVFLAQDEPVLVSKLSSIGGGLSLLIEQTMRAVSIQVDKVSGVSGFVLPGDRVDVIAVVRPTGASTDVHAKTILQNLEVLAAGTKTEQKGRDPITVQSVTLLVEPQGAEALALASSEGKIHLSLRNPNDTQLAAETGGLSKSALLGVKKKPKKKSTRPRRRSTPKPKKKVTPPPKPDSLTIIRGTDASKQTPAMRTPEPSKSDKDEKE
jgi:pilus assembly protein CpaB